MNVGEIIASLRAGLGAQGDEPAGQGLVAGQAGMPVSRVVVCQSPSVGVLRAAGSQPGTLVVAREHPFYIHDGSVWSSGLDGDLRKAVDPVVLGKQAVIDRGGLAVYRLCKAWDTARPKGQSEALADVLGWKAAESGGGRKAVCDVAPTTLDALARHVRDRLDAGRVRVTGPSGAKVRRVALLPEFVELAEARDLMASTPAIDALVCGETCEWEAAPYLKDTLDMRRVPIGVIFAGTQPTQEPGVRRMHEWIARQVAGVPVTYMDVARPVSHLETRR